MKMMIWTIILFIIFINYSYSQNFKEIYPQLKGLSHSTIDFIDFDNDSIMDVFICGNEGIHLYKNKGNGEIYEVDENTIKILEYKVVYDYDEPRFAWADFNEDGYIDLALQARFKINGKYDPYLLIYKNYDGKLKIIQYLPGVLGNIDLGDYDGDSDLDIITTGIIYDRSIQTKIFENTNGKFNEIANTILGVIKGVIKWIDINNDIYKDVVVSGWRDEGLFSGIYINNEGNFIKKDIEIKKYYLSDIDVVDFNKDGFQDFILAGLGDNDEVGVYLYLNQKNESFTSINLAAYGITPLYAGSIKLGDYNNDGEYDLLISGKSKSKEYKVDVYKNYGGLNLKKIKLDIPGIYYGDAIFKDFNRDGFLDIGITGYSQDWNLLPKITKIYINAGGDEWNELGIKDFFDGFALPCDFDNDHDYDLLIGGKGLTKTPETLIYENVGNNIFIKQNLKISGLYNQKGTDHFGLLDFNGDNKIDFVISGTDAQGNSNLRMYLNLGNFNFIDITDSIGLQDTPKNSSILILDYDNDGDQDLITTNRIYENQLGIRFVAHDLNFHTASGTNISSIDFDGDSDFDILSFQEINTGFWSYEYTGYLYKNNGLFNLFKILDFPIGSTSRYPVAARWADYDNDGFGDLFLCGKIYRNLFGDTLIDISAGLEEYNEGDIRWGDMDNDGDLDLIYSGRITPGWYDSPRFEFYRNDGYGTFTKVEYDFPSFTNGAINLFDYDNDNDLDLFYLGQESFTRLYQNAISIKNTRPTAPTNLKTTIFRNSITLEWSPSSDNETPSSGLTYNIALRKEGKEEWIISPMADTTDGFRYIVDFGNVGQNTRWVLKNLSPGIYYWRVQAIDNSFVGSNFSQEERFIIGTTDITNNQNTINEFKLFNNYPNPFNPTTTIIYTLPRFAKVKLTIFNIVGQKIRTLVDTKQPKGKYQIQWDGRDEQGNMVAGGVYLYQLSAQTESGTSFYQVKKMIFIK